MGLKWMQRAIEYELCSVNGVSNDDYFGNIFLVASLVDSASYSKKFHFQTCYKHHMMNCFYKREVGLINVCNRCSYVVLDASISYNESSIWRGVLKNQIIEFLSTKIVFFIFVD